MVRKTKEDAELTKRRIMDAARAVFLRRGVSRSTLEHIATEANVTRGAVYWHFKNKTEIFHAIREQVFLPLFDKVDDVLSHVPDSSKDPLSQIEASLCQTIQDLDASQTQREIYEIIMIKCEYVDEFAAVLHQILDNCSSLVEKYELAYQRAQAKNLIAPKLSAHALALDTHLFFGGLLHMWIKDSKGTQFRHQAIEMIKAHIDLRRKL
ncbi:MAG: TetR family transcriptional regulator [Betaproteobacteria bacterium HGW-Betaproteobacteria-22]|nr:MAG: TetR family transcriptional regulator [Betaproteobacteria bacterium HGW-Betaproteobacteria-22]